MRRKDREVTDWEELIEIIRKCDVCRLAIQDEPVPYILPLNFGLEVVEGKALLYFHGAREGRKYELLAQNNRVAFEFDCAHRLVLLEEEKNCTMEYESVIGSGTVEEVPEAEKEHGLAVLMGQYRWQDFPYNKQVVPATKVLRLSVEQMTGKRRMTKKKAE